jgi:hypothetical protein
MSILHLLKISRIGKSNTLDFYYSRNAREKPIKEKAHFTLFYFANEFKYIVFLIIYTHI